MNPPSEVLALNLATDIFEPGEYTPLMFDQPGTRKQFAKLESHWRRKDGNDHSGRNQRSRGAG